ncbi:MULTISPECIES: hypothetical protein [Streptosporangium]|uniref:Uncharacterized protein n=1 Tax=Streptosporangium brasiliense TaxID=47480 RepID=A0ABT9RAY8_9ACTN|nr:hypothetical protein [Streptosporangium brasiliense]MDP9866431.1 hypothetical protein [Streptosporangium brasiliense]
MLVELTMRRSGGDPSNNSPVDGIRILALLPEKWRKDLRQATGEIVIRIHTDEETTSEQICAKVIEILADPAVNHWKLATCHILTTGNRESKEADHDYPHIKGWGVQRMVGGSTGSPGRGPDQRAQWN